MEHRPLDHTGVSASPLCLGTMMVGPWGNDDRAEAVRIIHSAPDAATNVADTADVLFVPRGEHPNQHGGSRRWIMREVENIELDVLPTTPRHGMGTPTYSPLSGGWLSGAWGRDSAPTSPAGKAS